MKKVHELTAKNLLNTFELYEVWDGPKGEVEIQILFSVVHLTIDTVIDNKNFAGEVTYEINTEYGGGPANITTTFAVVDGNLEIEEDLIDTNELDWNEIDENIANEMEKPKIIN